MSVFHLFKLKRYSFNVLAPFFRHSGLGDLDTEGIIDFIDSHACTNTCLRFRFQLEDLRNALEAAKLNKALILKDQDEAIESGALVDDYGSTFEIHQST